MTKPKNKNYCSQCHSKHIPPTGKKCKKQSVKSCDHGKGPQSLSDDSDVGFRDNNMSFSNVIMSTHKKVVVQKNCKVKRCCAPRHSGPSIKVPADASEEECSSGGLQNLILKELCRINDRLDVVEQEMDTRRRRKIHKQPKLSTPNYSINKHVKTKSMLIVIQFVIV